MIRLKYFSWNVYFLFLFLILSPHSAFAYIGPGAGVSAIGAFLAVIVGIIVAIFGFLWYPIKRFLKKKRLKNNTQSKGTE